MATNTEDVLKQLDMLIKKYEPGGEFGKGELALLERQKTKSLARTQSGMVGAGLAGTTAAAGAGQKWEEEIGMPSRLQIEDIKSQRLMQAMQAKAGYTERTEARTRAEEEAQRQRIFEESMAKKYGGVGGAGGGAGGAPGTHIGDRPGWALGEQPWEQPGYQPGGGSAGTGADYGGAQDAIYGGGGDTTGADQIKYDLTMQQMQQAGKVGGYGASDAGGVGGIGGGDSMEAYRSWQTSEAAKAQESWDATLAKAKAEGNYVLVRALGSSSKRAGHIRGISYRTWLKNK